MQRFWFLIAAMACLTLAFAACEKGDDDDDNGGGGGGQDDDEADDDESPESACNDPTLDLYAAYCPTYNDPCKADAYEYNLDQDTTYISQHGLLVGDIEAMQFKFQAPFHVKKLKFHFRRGAGTARIHLYGDLLGSVPYVLPWSTLMSTVEYMEPIDVEVADADAWVEVDVTDRNLMFLPGTRVWAAYEHLSGDGMPELWMSNEDDPNMTSRYYSPTVYQQYGERWGYSGKFYAIRLEGSHFCQLEGPTTFSNVTTAAGITTLGQHRGAWVDLDNDGLNDLLLTQLSVSETDPQNLTYYHNNGDGTFTDLTTEAGFDLVKYSSVNLFADIDNDGDKDLISLVAVPHDPELDTGERTKLLLNDGTGHFAIQADTGLCNTDANFSSAGFGDYDRDGYLDLYVGTWLLEYPNPESDPDFLFHSNGDLTWTDVSLTSGIREDDDNPAEYKPSYGVTWVDYNDDGWYDIFVSNYGRTFNLLFENQGDGTFVEVGTSKNLDRPHTGTMGPGNTFGADFGDANNDGYFDAIVSDIAHPRYEPGSGMSSFNLNDGPPDFAYTWANDQVLFHEDEGDVDPSFVDYNNDGRLDMFISSLYGGHYSRFYEQQEDGTWLDVSYWTGVETLAAAGNAWADYDGDGKMDLCSIFEPRADGVGGVWLFHNDIDNGNHWLEIDLIGVADNRDAIGAKIKVTAGDLNVYRYVQGPRGHYGATPMFRQHFGLAQQSIVDTIEVRWPDGETETWSGVNADQIITLTQGDPNVGK